MIFETVSVGFFFIIENVCVFGKKVIFDDKLLDN